MASDYKWIDLNDCRGGRDGASDPLSLKPNEVTEMRNGDTFRCIFFRKRGGAAAPAIGNAFTGVISSLLSHFPSNNLAAAELWGCDDATPPALGRMAAASTFSNPTTIDAPSTGAGAKVRGASFNGKLFLAYQSAQDRLHDYDPTLAAPAVRRVGLATPGEPSLANFATSGGTASQGVVYRVRFRIKNGTQILAQSEPSATDATVTTVNGTETFPSVARTVVTMPTAPDSATHWVIEAAIALTAPTVFYEQIELPITTTTWTNANSNTAATTYVAIGTLSELLGLYAKWPSVKYVIAAFNRLLGLGQWGGTASAPITALVVGGGGGGGSAGGGGGAGDVLTQSNVLVAVQAYTVTIGGGGAKGTAGGKGTDGTDTTVGAILTAKGGGGGGGNLAAAGNGGSGGGGGDGVALGAGGSQTGSRGNAGGTSTARASSGGGGAGNVGEGNTVGPLESAGTRGGIGLSITIDGTTTVYGGGGGGGGATSTVTNNAGGTGGTYFAAGLVGGAGNGGSATNATTPTAGTANTGGGGGGGGYNGGTTYDGANGGSGKVVIRYPTGSLVATGGTITTVGTYTVHTFTGNGTFTVTSIAQAALKQSRVFISAAAGESDPAHGDDERVPNALTQRNWQDLDENTGGDGTGFAGPIAGAVYVFKYQQIRTLTPTGASAPIFNLQTLSTTKGAIDQECICVGEDALGRPCVYFMDAQVGPMIVGAMPPTEIGQGIRDLWDTVNLSATNKVGQVIDYPKLGQVWFWVATGASNDPNLLALYTKATGAWSVVDTGGKIRSARCAALFARTPGASMSKDLVPYTGYQAANNTLLRGDTTDLDDSGTTYQAIVKTRPIAANNGKPFRVTTPYLLAKVQDGVTLTVTADGDFGRIVKPSTVSLTPTADELAAGATRVIRRVEGLDLTDVTYIQFQVGDAAAIAKGWTVERLYVPILPMDGTP